MQQKKLLIIGAGSAGRMIAQEFRKDTQLSSVYRIAGFLDDNPAIQSVGEYPVLGPVRDARPLIEQQDIDEVVIAIPSADQNEIGTIMKYLENTQVRIKIVPGIPEIVAGAFTFNQIKDFDPADLLGREEVSFDPAELAGYYENKTVFVTGAGGSIGSEIVIQLLHLPVKQVIAFGHGENSIYHLANRITEKHRFRYIIGDIRDYPKLLSEMKRCKPEIVFHAAAHKHVPLMEEYPDEALKNNVLGTYHTAKAAIESGIRRFIFVSTDKAVNPTSVMGATKRISERIVLSLGHLQHETLFSLTRFGNVLGSRGSVIPLFKTQIDQGGPVTITHPEVTRFFMSIREAARLVIKSGTIEHGKIFVLDMGKPVKIVDLAQNMIKLYAPRHRNIPVVFTGLRKGEKLYEEILTENESLSKTLFDKLFVSDEKQMILSGEDLEKLIGQVKEVSDSFDRKRILELIQHYVPEYPGRHHPDDH